MKYGNTIQWVVIATVVAVALVVWFKPNKSPPWEATGEMPDVQLPEVYSSNEVLVAVAPVRIHAQTGMSSATAKAVAAKAWNVTADILEQIDGVRLIRSAHPQVMVTVTILDLHDERHQFKGYSIETRSVEVRCSLRIQVLDTASGAIAFSRTLSGEKDDTQNAVVNERTSESERTFGAIEAALHTLATNAEFKSAIMPPKTNPITPTKQSLN